MAAAAITVIGGAIASNQQKKSAERAAEAQRRGITEAQLVEELAREEGQTFLEPFAELGQQGIEQSGFLTDTKQQFDFLQNNPLFQLSLQKSQEDTQNLAAARGRVSAGDTLQRLSENVLLSAQPLVSEQKRSIENLLNIGTGIAQTQANVAIGKGSNISNLLTSAGDVDAAREIALGNAQAQQTNAITEGVASVTPLLVNKFSGRTTPSAT